MIKYTSNEAVNWNQLVKNGDFSDGTSGWNKKGNNPTSVTDKILSIINSTPTDYTMNQKINYIVGHKYISSIVARVSNGNQSVKIYFGDSSNSAAINFTNTSFTKKSVLFTCQTNQYNEIRLGFQGTVDEVFYIYSVTCIDLTAIYGAGNEPTTVAQFEADYKSWFGKDLDYEPYAPIGTIRYKERYLKKRYISFNPSDYDGIQGTVVKTSTALVPNNSMNWLRDTDGNLIFPDGMKKAGSVYDELKVENGVLKAIKRIGSVDLGKLNWEYNSDPSDTRFYVNTNIIKKPNADSNIANIVCAKYSTKSYTDLYNHTTDKVIAYRSFGQLDVSDSSYSNADTFKLAMSGVMLYYELATPIEYTVKNIREVNKVYIGEDLVFANSDYYGVRWVKDAVPVDSDDSVPMERIGRMEWHRTLPIHNKMKRCIVGSDGSKKYINPYDYTKFEDGSDVDYTLSEANGITYDIMTEIPEHYFETGEEVDNDVTYCYIKLYPYAHKGHKVPHHYIGCFEAALNRSNNTLFSVAKVPIVYNADGEVDAADVVGSSSNAEQWKYRGVDGNNYTSGTEPHKSICGRPASSINVTNFCNYANNRNSSATEKGYALYHWEAHNCIQRLFYVEYATFNCQKAFTPNLDDNGRHKGGLGFGTCSATDNWNNYNGYRPIMPCGITLKLVNTTGIVKYNLGGEYTSGETSFNVPSYRGIENPFAHIWKIINGMYIIGADNKNYIYTAIDGWNVKTFPQSIPSTPTVMSGYKEVSDKLGLVSGWPTQIEFDEDGCILPKTLDTTSSNTSHRKAITHDYFRGNNTGAKRAMVGGSLNYGVRAGLACLHCYNGVGKTNLYYGSRLLKLS